MLKKLIIIGLTFIFCLSLYAKNDAKYFRKIYSQAVDIKEKRDKVKEISLNADETFKSLILDILDEQINYGIERNVSIRRDAEEWILYTAKTAGSLKITEASIKLKALYDYVTNNIIRGEILSAIGKIGNKDNLSWLNLLMKDYNDAHRRGGAAGTKGIEEEIYGLVSALGEYKDPSSFKYLFYASIPNYSEKIRLLASETIKKVTNDPASVASDMIISEERLDIVIALVNYIYNSQSSNDGKIRIMILGVERGLATLGSKDPVTKRLQEELKDTAVTNLGNLKASSPEAVRMIERKWDENFLIKDSAKENINRILTNIDALEKIATPEAVSVLINKIKYFNDKTKDGSKTGYGQNEGALIMTAIIRALGNTAKSSEAAYDELLRVKSAAEYGEPLRVEADKALKKLGY